jgi:hypothetical protein
MTSDKVLPPDKQKNVRLKGATDDQITAQLHNNDGSIRTFRDVGSALRADGLGVRDSRIAAKLQAAGAEQRLPGATPEQIKAHLRKNDGSLRTHKDVVSALRAVGVGVRYSRVVAELQTAGAARPLPGATDEQITAHLHNKDDSLRTQAEVRSALRADGLGVDSHRLPALMQVAGGGTTAARRHRRADHGAPAQQR